MNIPDILRPPSPGAVRLNEYFTRRLDAGVANHLKRLDYRKLVDFFRERPNPFAAGEFWGKTVRSVVLTYQHTGDPELKRILDNTVADLLSTQTPDGCISTRTYDEQPKSSDLWERKYVLLGLLGYYEIDPQPAVLNAMVRMADYTLNQVGPAPKVRIVDTGWAFEGIESSTILEPMVKLYNLTGHQRYLDFCRYIVETEGACKRVNVFEATLAGVAPKDIGGNGETSIAKAYESMSCFEGLIEYYRVTGEPKWKQAAMMYWRAVRDQEMTILGSGGGDKPFNLGPGQGEQWNGLATEQTHPGLGKMMETCVTVTWMKLCYQLLRLTGETEIVDEIERSLYNALAGAQKPGGGQYDYYQKLNGQRNSKDGFGSMIGDFSLSCCTANGPMGLALLPFACVMQATDGVFVNLYAFESAALKTPGGAAVRLDLTTDYPKGGKLRLVVMPERPERFSINLRVPAWSRRTMLTVKGQTSQEPGGSHYVCVNRIWEPGDVIELELDMTCRVMPAPRGTTAGSEAYVALQRGPLVLTRDRRLGGAEVSPVAIPSDPIVTPLATEIGQVAFNVRTTDGRSFPVIDYASAGATWDERSAFCTWLPKASET